VAIDAAVTAPVAATLVALTQPVLVLCTNVLLVAAVSCVLMPSPDTEVLKLIPGRIVAKPGMFVLNDNLEITM